MLYQKRVKVGENHDNGSVESTFNSVNFKFFRVNIQYKL